MYKTDTPDLITVIIPTYNRSALLQRAIVSVLQETRVPLRVHVFDNASTDDTPEVIQQLAAQDDRVVCTRHAANIGGIANFQHALASVDTTYFVPLADDDMLLEGFLYKAYTLMQTDPDLGASIFLTVEMLPDNRVVGFWPCRPEHLPEGKLSPTEHMRFWMKYSHHGWSSILWRADQLAVLGAPYLHPSLPGDVDFQAQIFSQCSVFVVKEAGAVYTQHPGQASRAQSMLEAPAWAEIFDRLDRRAQKNELFSREEYLNLRYTMWSRYRGVWNQAPAVPLTAQQAARLAVIAAFRLGDWPLAFRLSDQAAFEPSVVPPIRMLPDPAGSDGLVFVFEERYGLMLKVIQWFKHAIGTHKNLASEMEGLRKQLDEAQVREIAATERAEALAMEAEFWKQRCLAAGLGAVEP